MASNGIQIGGLISGLDTQSLIARMMQLERQPLVSLQTKKDKAQVKADALRDVNTRLSSLLTAVKKLAIRSNVDARSVTVATLAGSTASVTATANSDAALGSFTLRVQSLATATTVTSASGGSPSAVGKAVSATSVLASAGFGITPTTGTFTVNGVKVTIDASTVLSDGVDAIGANTIFAKIRDATSGLAADKRVSVAWGLDANGRQNKLVLSATGAIQLGSGSDTSNFLTAAGLAALPSATTMTSGRNLGGVNTGEYLDTAAANLDVALSASTGKFKINGVEINYDATVDTLNSLISRINSSAANVTASFDSLNDRLTLTARNTGGSLIDLEDVTGNFLAAIKLSASNETLGASAGYLLNSVQRYSTSNTVTDALPGVTLNLKKEDSVNDVTVTVSQDVSATVSNVQDFVKQYNSTISFIREKTAYDPTTKKGAVLMGDPTIQSIERSLSSLITGYGDGLSTAVRALSDVGITTGAVGSAVGSTDALVLDSAKLTAKLQSNASAVADLFGGLTVRTSLEAGGTGSIASISGNPSNHVSGSYAIASDASGNLTVTFTPAAGGATNQVTGTITANGTNSTLIPGVVLTAKGVLAAGTDTVTTTVSLKGVGIKLSDYLTGLTSTTGLFARNQESSDKQIADINKSISKMEERLSDKEDNLNRKFAALEKALAQYQTQSSALSQQLAQLSR